MFNVISAIKVVTGISIANYAIDRAIDGVGVVLISGVRLAKFIGKSNDEDKKK